MIRPSRVFARGETLPITGDDSTKCEENDTCDGWYDSALGEIHIREDANPLQWLYILGHEITHHWLIWSGLAQLLPKKMIEAICDCIGRAFVDFIMENEHMVRYCWEVRDGETNNQSEAPPGAE